MVALVVVGGLCDIGAFVAYAIGLQVAPVWLVGLASSFGPVLAVAYAIWRLGERPHATQWAGLGLIAAGVAVLALVGCRRLAARRSRRSTAPLVCSPGGPIGARRDARTRHAARPLRSRAGARVSDLLRTAGSVRSATRW